MWQALKDGCSTLSALHFHLAVLAHQLRGVRLLALLDQVEGKSLFRIELPKEPRLMRLILFVKGAKH